MRVAVVGSGVSGLGATWLLNEHTDHEVHLFEADSRPGGHANTVTYDRPGKEPTDVDTGFIVFNPSTYPNFINFLNIYPDLAERILPTEMTFAVSRNLGAFEWAGNNLSTVFCQPSRLLDLEMWRLIYDVLRFNANAQKLLIDMGSQGGPDKELSIGTYLKQNGYSDSFRDNYLIPMTAAIWSTPPDKCALDFPAYTLVGITSSNFHLSTPIKSLRSIPGNKPGQAHPVQLTTASDTTVNILNAGGGMTAEEARILEAFKWNKNEAVLHCDEQLMPKSRIAWSCWNYLTQSVTDDSGKYLPNVNQVSLTDIPYRTYWMNELQHLSMDAHGPVLVTLNPPFDPKPALTFGHYKYDHPILSDEAIRAQDELPTIQRTRGISYAGAWTKYGFHEDGFSSGLRAAAALIAPSPSSSTKSQSGSGSGSGSGSAADPDAIYANPKLPFKIVPADRTPDRAAVHLARAFVLFEASGAAYVLGSVFAFGLALLRTFVGALGVDLSHLDSGGRDYGNTKRART
ncbi:hypothetical protein C8Q74DRAFT_1218472 [Fomes fomentarius]|nr:hypothetical protein C8Q74DRAFT_1218472 [Fomes fomentarius]